jgi:hypothetical protein
MSLLLLVAAGCRSTPPAHSNAVASIQIHGHDPGHISQMVERVFLDHGYKLAKGGLFNQVFEKSGGTMNNIAYGNWLDETPVWSRVKISLTPVQDTVYWLDCEPFLVRGLNSSTEEEIKLSKLRARPYRKLLEEVANRLNSSIPP